VNLSSDDGGGYLTAELLDRLPNLKLIASTGTGNAAIDPDAVKRRGIEVLHTGYNSNPAFDTSLSRQVSRLQNS
jgi:lactate dehydrogenase-like 2-hydroxyacid dehydrogenase